MLYSVYVLKSQKNSDVYVGSTNNVEKRLRQHNSGIVRSTKANRPWILLEQRPCISRSEAVRLEMLLKSGQQKETLRKKHIFK